jgi:hypothetical protein
VSGPKFSSLAELNGALSASKNRAEQEFERLNLDDDHNNNSDKSKQSSGDQESELNKLMSTKMIKTATSGNGVVKIPTITGNKNFIPETASPQKTTPVKKSPSEDEEKVYSLSDYLKDDEKDENEEIKLEDLKKVGDLGSGSQGHVSKMLHKPTNKFIALKVNIVVLTKM